jgi:nitroreductase
MTDVLGVIEERHSARFPFDRSRSIARQDLLQVLEAARWAPTAHNMQNFHIVVIDDRKLLDTIGMGEFTHHNQFGNMGLD